MGSAVLQSEAALQLAPPGGGQAEGAAVEVLAQPFALEESAEQPRPQGAGEMGTAFAPVEAGAGEAAPLGAQGFHLQAQQRETLAAHRREFVGARVRGLAKPAEVQEALVQRHTQGPRQMVVTATRFA